MLVEASRTNTALEGVLGVRGGLEAQGLEGVVQGSMAFARLSRGLGLHLSGVAGVGVGGEVGEGLGSGAQFAILIPEKEGRETFLALRPLFF